MSDDMILDIFWEQISAFIIANERAYKDACDKKSQNQKARWEEYKKLKAEKAASEGQQPEPDPYTDDEELPFGNYL